MELGFVYVLTNPAMPGLVKIGYTNQMDVNERSAQLYTAGVPVPFTIEFACKVPNFKEVEDAFHTAFAPYRVNPRREFFRIDPEQPIAILRLLHTEDATVEVTEQPVDIDQQSILAGKRLRGPNFDFEKMGIPVGSILQFIKDEGTTVTVVDSRRVKYIDEVSFLAGITKSLLGINRAIRPTLYWKYHGKLLLDIYEETYGEPYGGVE